MLLIHFKMWPLQHKINDMDTDVANCTKQDKHFLWVSESTGWAPPAVAKAIGVVSRLFQKLLNGTAAFKLKVTYLGEGLVGKKMVQLKCDKGKVKKTGKYLKYSSDKVA
jgi:hypothetical protein